VGKRGTEVNFHSGKGGHVSMPIRVDRKAGIIDDGRAGNGGIHTWVETMVLYDIQYPTVKMWT